MADINELNYLKLILKEAISKKDKTIISYIRIRGNQIKEDIEEETRLIEEIENMFKAV